LLSNLHWITAGVDYGIADANDVVRNDPTGADCAQDAVKALTEVY